MDISQLLDPERIYRAIIVVTEFIILLTFHEWGHAKSAHMLGDSTAKDDGRLTFNPAAHIDPIATILLPLLGVFFGGMFFGWAKPVPVDPRNLRNPKRDMMFIAADPVKTDFLGENLVIDIFVKQFGPQFRVPLMVGNRPILASLLNACIGHVVGVRKFHGSLRVITFRYF